MTVVEKAQINFGGKYDAPLGAGEHLITVVPIPNREQAAPSQMRLKVEPGQIYKFTAKRLDVAIVLK